MPGGGDRGGEPNPLLENSPDAENREIALKLKYFNSLCQIFLKFNCSMT